MKRVIEIIDARPLMPSAVHELRTSSQREGLANVAILVRDWNDATLRFDCAGETLLVARVEDVTIAVGGLRQCRDVPEALRISRFYVAPAWRRRGVATTLASEILRRSEEFTELVSCNAQASPGAAPFWETLGFVPVNIEGVTHLRHAPAP